MKQSEAAEFLPLLKAWSEGKTLQVKQVGGQWVDLDVDFNASLTSSPETYRIKPELIIRYGLVSKAGVSTYSSEPEALEVMRMHRLKIVKMVRLIEDLDYVPPTS